MTRWLVALAVLALVAAAGYVFFLNPDPTTVHLGPSRTVEVPLAVALLSAFGLGALLVGLASATRAGVRGWQGWRARRQASREARQAASTARAEALLWAGEHAQARAELLRGGVSADVKRLALLAETHLKEGAPAAARTLLEQAVTEVGFDARLLDLLADAAERTGDLRGAADALERARTTLADSPRLAGRLRDVYAAAGRWAEALALQDHILLGTHDRETLAREEPTRLGLRYQTALGESDATRGARLLLRLTHEAPDFVAAWVSAGDLLAATGRSFAARRCWERGTRHRPAVVLLERLEHLNATEQRPDRTTRFLRRLVRRHPAAPAVSFHLARFLMAQGELGQAAEVLSALPAPLAGHPLAHALWGELHRRRGDHNLASDSYARATGPDLGLIVPFRCTACREVIDTWRAYCSACRRWDTYETRAECATAPT